MTFIIGLNAWHGDSSACLLHDGEIVAAAEEERFRRIKHWAGFPCEAITYCLTEAGISLDAVEHIAINSDPRACIGKKLWYVLKSRSAPSLLLDRIRNQIKRHSIELELARAFPNAVFSGKVHRVEHHMAHLASAFLVSPFNRAVVVSVDGFGDFSSAAWGMGEGTDISVGGRVHFPHSLGIFYQALTQYLGFANYGDEYKVMGLAPYGEPRFVDEMRKIVHLKGNGAFALDTQYFRHHKRRVDYEWTGGAPTVGRLYSDALIALLGPARRKDTPLVQRHYDIAHSVQAMYEEAFFHLLDALHGRYGGENLAIAGGCGMNSVANGKVRRRTRFRRVYVQSAAGDAGGAIGAALAVWHRPGNATEGYSARNMRSPLRPDPDIRHMVMDHAFLGAGFESGTITALLEAHRGALVEAGCTVIEFGDEARLCAAAAALIADGQVVGWFQGRMEWGPRALGNRSIVCDPRRADMKDILNSKIKRRESFRPFAPSVLKEHVGDWFEEDDDVPFMTQVFQVHEGKRLQIPAVTHVDGSGRLQTVYRETNPRYYRLIDTFRELTGVPMVLNTSFNENEPVVCHPQEALDCFLRTRMDALILGDFLVCRQ